VVPAGDASGARDAGDTRALLVRPVRRVFVVSSEERDAQRRHRAHQRERAEAEGAKVLRQGGRRWYPTAERAATKVEAILERHHLRELYYQSRLRRS
jgi:hypothetical protein